MPVTGSDAPNIPQEKQFAPPPSGFYKCCACGIEKPIIDKNQYYAECDCPDNNCFGQMFCNEWGGWSNA